MSLKIGYIMWIKALFVWTFIAFSLHAAEQENDKSTKSEKESPKLDKEIFSQTKHSITIDGNLINYTATAGNYILKDEKNNGVASIFFVAYTKDDVKDISKRPLTFSFNGGPGSSAIWLHIGALGPERIAVTEEGRPLLPPHLEQNGYSILDVTDLVFIDPVGTGYSQAIPVEDKKKYFNVDGDVRSIAEFIRLYITRNDRWTSPKFLAGESYGTTRAAMLALYLHDHDRINLNGIILISSILDFQPYFIHPSNDLPFSMFLPSYTAVAWYHKKLSPEYQQDRSKAITDSENFARGDYLVALQAGDRLTPDQKAAIAKKLSLLTGVPEEIYLQNDLRLPPSRFDKELLRQDNRIIGHFDGRLIGLDFDNGSDSVFHDPAYSILFGPFAAAFNHYLREDLKVEKDDNYEVLIMNDIWDYSKAATNQYLTSSDDLKRVMSKNKNLKVYVASGLYDLATPYFAGQYVINHMNLDPSIRSNVTGDYYDAGHMLFIHKPSMVKLKQKLSKFIQDSQNPQSM
jgi:carboxypeptidase C (cathepsin A)